MSMRRERSRAVRPLAEDLETRRLLSATFRGTDLDGDTYTLRLAGTGDFRVTLVTASGTAVTDPTQPALIDTIAIAGANPTTSRLIGKVTRGPSGDGKVFFDQITEQGGRAEGPSGTLGIHAIDIPNFWLGATTSGPAPGTAGSITIPDGVNTLRFGGVDTTFTRPGATPLNQNNANDAFTVNLGLPYTQGTSIIINKSVTSGQAAASSTGQATQDSVNFNVAGRLNVFQADTIEGNTSVPITEFQGGGGTRVISNTDTPTGVTGQIGFIRVGGNATNFVTQTNDKISNFYVGGETNTLFVLSPGGTRNLYFGKGLDTATIRTHYIMSLNANRGALNSDITVDRNVGTVIFGGDVSNVNFLAGVQQNLGAIFSNQTAPTNTLAQDGGSIQQLLIAGNVIDSVFAASVEPSPDNVYGTDQDLVLPHGIIRAKVEGSISNSDTVTAEPNRAFFAHQVDQFGGPVVPPNVPEAPFPNPGAPPSGSRVVPGLQPTSTPVTRAGGAATSASAQVRAARATTAAVPKGPASAKAKAQNRAKTHKSS